MIAPGFNLALDNQGGWSAGGWEGKEMPLIKTGKSGKRGLCLG